MKNHIANSDTSPVHGSQIQFDERFNIVSFHIRTYGEVICGHVIRPLPTSFTERTRITFTIANRHEGACEPRGDNAGPFI